MRGGACDHVPVMPSNARWLSGTTTASATSTPCVRIPDDMPATWHATDDPDGLMHVLRPPFSPRPCARATELATIRKEAGRARQRGSARRGIRRREHTRCMVGRRGVAVRRVARSVVDHRRAAAARLPKPPGAIRAAGRRRGRPDARADIHAALGDHSKSGDRRDRPAAAATVAGSRRRTLPAGRHPVAEPRRRARAAPRAVRATLILAVGVRSRRLQLQLSAGLPELADRQRPGDAVRRGVADLARAPSGRDHRGGRRGVGRAVLLSPDGVGVLPRADRKCGGARHVARARRAGAIGVAAAGADRTNGSVAADGAARRTWPDALDDAAGKTPAVGQPFHQLSPPSRPDQRRAGLRRCGARRRHLAGSHLRRAPSWPSQCLRSCT